MKNPILIIILILLAILVGYLIYHYHSQASLSTPAPTITEATTISASPSESPSSTVSETPSATPGITETPSVSPTPTRTATPSASQIATATPTPPQTASVSIQNFSFNPSSLTIRVGDTARWTNNDSAPHTITSDNNVLNSPTLSTGQSFEFIFTTKGTFPYHCSIHPFMTAQIIVQ